MATKTKSPQAREKARQNLEDLPLPASVVGLLNKAQVRKALGGCSVRKLSEMISSGEFPRADKRLRASPRWSVELVNEWCRSLGNVQAPNKGRLEP